MRASSASDFAVPVEGVGTFVFAKRQMRDELRIAAEFSRLTEGVDTPTPWLELVAGWISTLKVLVVQAPDEFSDFDAIDPLDEDVYAKLARIHAALREKEGSFRRKPATGDAGRGADDGIQPRVLVPSQVQPGAD